VNGNDPHGPALGTPVSRRSARPVDDWRLRSLRTGPKGGVPTVAPRTDHWHRYHRPLLATLALFVAVAAIAVFVVQAFVVRPYTVHGSAMTPALQSGDRMLVLKPSMLRGSVHAGDIVVVHPSKTLPCSTVGGGDLVLRVAALPGSVISSTDDTILIDGKVLHERGWYDTRFGQLGSTPIRRTTLDAGQYFVLADNRSNACDSRTLGPISRSSIRGEGIAVVGRNGHLSFGTL
jgi:signal peptidase I